MATGLGQNQKRAFDIHPLQPSKRLQVNLDQRAGQREAGIHNNDVHATPSRADSRKGM